MNSTAASLLGFLHDGPLTGWELVQTAQRRIGDFWSLTPSQVYRELNAMAAAGLLRAGERGRRERRPFAITEAGRQAFRAWLAAGPADETIRMPMLLTLLFGEHLPPERLSAILRHQRALHAARLAAYEAGNTSAERAARSVYQQATLDFGINHERAVLAWFDRLPRGLRGG
ncbi:MAG TPA: PadR family transcriptional regulator [Candidatus Limnocylindria bacterium]|nr:PadR family transcriptional regulator [Candidatus Limnocylindria bacterium]